MAFLFFWEKPETPEDREKKYLLSLDLSPLDYKATSHAVAHKVNMMLGMRDWNSRIANGQILYPHEQDARRREILAVPVSFYEENFK